MVTDKRLAVLSLGISFAQERLICPCQFVVPV
ncbi:hypothetical protein PAHAL_6G247000 [Panicum hallii]|uniref:Uncharacterized protein n=1 Tax=Panicum hallii TaxID=206008 RepID=A0A2T8IHG0_9POAL|nr:hypothetical protein PAHAL_6G247000 [Panicum hallii]